MDVALIIGDDEEDNLDVASVSLILSGYNEEKFQRVTCGEDTIETVKEMQTRVAEVPLVVLLDLNMPPQMGGAERATILDQMEGLERPPMLVCCSAGQVSDIKAQSYAKHFRYFITKSFTPASAEELLREIETWVESKQ